MPVLADIFKAKKDYRPCTVADIVPHFALISHWVPEEERNDFQDRMHKCVQEGNAWCLDNAFLYYTKENKRIAHGVALFGQQHPLELLSLFIGVFSFEDNATHILRFKLHPGKFLEEYKTMLTKTSIMRTHRNPEHPLMVRVDDFRKKIVNMLNLTDIRK